MDNLNLDSQDKPTEMIEKGGIKIPKLDLTTIYLQREVVSTNNDNSQDNGTDEEGEYYEEEGEEVDSKARKENFEKQKLEFK